VILQFQTVFKPLSEGSKLKYYSGDTYMPSEKIMGYARRTHTHLHFPTPGSKS